MKPRKAISTSGARVTATISVALVLLLLGIISVMAVASRSVTDNIKENMGFDVVMADETPDPVIKRMKQHFMHAPYVSSVVFHSADDALSTWQNDTGEDLIALLGVNPFSPEFEIKVKAQYASTDSLDIIVEALRRAGSVTEVNVHADIVDDVNRTLDNVALVLLVASMALALIALVLINNTIRLSVYSRRFTIHTMRLVGATRGFIRRPFVLSSVIQGVIAAAIAVLLLGGLLYYVDSLNPAIASIVTAADFWGVAAAMLLAGILLCGGAAMFATNRYLGLDYDDLFK